MISMLLAIPVATVLSLLVTHEVRDMVKVSIGMTCLALLQTEFLIIFYDSSLKAGSQWIEQMDKLGIYGPSLWLIWLVYILMPIVILSIYKSIPDQKTVWRPGSSAEGIFERRLRLPGPNALPFKQILILLLLIGFFSVAVFTVADLLLFYISFEGTLIPMYFVITLYGSRNRKVHASYMFFIYTLVGSLFLFLALLGLYIEYGSGQYEVLLTRRSHLDFGFGSEQLLWLAFFICFMIKLPMVGVHTWLLQAHTEAPTAGSVLLAAILLKLGSYGLLKYSLPLFPNASEYFRSFVIVLCLISLLSAAIAALSQPDFKVIIAYSSIAHMGTATLGLFCNDAIGIMGSIYFLVSHGLISAALFLLVGVLYDRHHTRVLIYFRGLVQVYPVFVTLLLTFSMANAAIPMSSGFIGEFLSLLGAFHYNPFVALLASLSIVLVPAFALTLLHRVSYGRFTSYIPVISSDITLKEIHLFMPLIFFVILFGVAPALILNDIMGASADLVA